jgi:hypothetical protein
VRKKEKIVLKEELKEVETIKKIGYMSADQKSSP